MEYYYICLYLMFLIIGFGIGFIFRFLFRKKKKYDGTIVIEKSAEDKETIRIIFDVELDDLKTKHDVSFKIDNQLS